jgi:hypothetical protein
MPKNDTIRKVVQRVRQQIAAAPANPATLMELEIPELFKIYSGRRFFLADSGPGASRILIFGKEDNIAWSSQIRHLYIDATFRITPSLFSQVLVILAKRVSYVVPIFYALLPGKSRVVYNQLFQMIKNVLFF